MNIQIYKCVKKLTKLEARHAFCRRDSVPAARDSSVGRN